MIFSFANPKGGAGKSTLATHFAVWLKSSGHSTLLLDTDRQGSAASWRIARLDGVDEQGQPIQLGPGFRPEWTPDLDRLYEREILHNGPSKAAQYDFTVVDTQGADGKGTRAALGISDVVIIPVRDGEFDRRALFDLGDVLNEVAVSNQRLKVVSFMNQVDSRRSFPKRTFELLEEAGLNPLNSMLRFRASIAKASLAETIFEATPQDEKAVFEMNKVFKDILEEIKK